MPNQKFHIQNRFLAFLQNLKPLKINIPQLIVYTIGWFLLFYGTMFSSSMSGARLIPILLIFGFFWFKILDEINDKIKPPVELLILLFLAAYAIEKTTLSIFLSAYRIASDPMFTPGILPSIIQVSILALLFFLFSFILIDKKKTGRGVLIGLFFAGYIAGLILQGNNTFYWWIFQFLLLLYLLKKTDWPEELTRVECWLYFALFVLIYRLFSNFPIEKLNNFQHGLFWNKMPFILFHFFRLYLIAVLIKIPLTLVYHHARLSQKLRIASLFQSSFPQLLQLLMLVFIFYFFVAGWQADQVRKSLENTFESLQNYSTKTDLHFIQKPLNPVDRSVHLTDSISITVPVNPPNNGIIKTMKGNNPEYYLFATRFSDSSNVISLIRIDSLLLQRVSHDIRILAGTSLAGYPFQLNQWDSLAYKIRSWHRQSMLTNFHIFPFGLFTSQSAKKISFRLPTFSDGDYDQKINLRFGGKKALTIGRVYSQFFNDHFQKTGFWAFDVEFLLNSAILNSTLARNILFWLGIYLLINFLIIQQVSKLGNRINRSIVHKFGQLKTGIRHISEGNLSYQIHVEGEDEFVELARRFNQMGEKLQQTIEEAREKDRLKYELKIAHDVQLSLLPQTIPVVPGFEVAAAMQTATEVGGDFYDVLPISKNRFLFIIGDVSGKGTSAAFYMAQCMSLARLSSQFSDDPKEIAFKLNKYFADHSQERQIFLTSIIGVIDAQRGDIELIRAGHTQPLLLSGSTKEIKPLEIPGLGIGLDRKQTTFRKILKLQAYKLKENDTLVCYTDGVLEAAKKDLVKGDTDETWHFYGEHRLMELLKKLEGKTSHEILRGIIADLKKFYGDFPQLDDFTLLVIKRVK